MPHDSDTRLIRHLAPKNFLSFGPEFPGLELRSLNVLIGPNGSGKSNLIEVINLLRASPKDWREVTRKGGGVAEWIWKGDNNGTAALEVVVRTRKGVHPLRHAMAFNVVSQGFALDEERIENEVAYAGESQPHGYYRYQFGVPVLNTLSNGMRRLDRDTIEPDRSILAQRRDPDAYPEVARLASSYESVRIYREWAFGRNTIFREPQQADMRRDVLEEDFSNLGLFLNRLKTEFPVAKRAILKALQDLYEGISDFEVNTSGGTVQVFLHEGDFAISATRLSDGTLRYLCLLAILCDPEPPPLICIEEPELGLHPDILPTLADLLKSASERTQLIVTTHSDILVDAMTDTPECVVICEKHEGKTEMNRLSAVDLSEWLVKYRLGQLWIDGQLGGKRW